MSQPLGEPHPAAAPLAYPQVLRTPAYAWWRSLVGILTVLVLVFVVAGLVFLPVLVAGVMVQAALEGTPVTGRLVSDAITSGRTTPAYLLYVNVTLASGTLVAWALVRWLHGLRPRWLTSVLPGMRWRFLLLCFPVAFLALLVNLVFSALLPHGAAPEGQQLSGLNHLGGQALAFGLIVVLTTPLQALAEEYVFRGYLTQAVGSLFARWTSLAAGAAVVLPALGFALAHGAQNPPLFFDRFAFGVLAGYLVLKVGGLEAGIALHVVNNLVAFGATILYGDMSKALSPGPASYWQIPVTVVENGFYLVVVLLLARRIGVRTRTVPAPLVSAPPAAPPIGDRPA